MAATSTNPTRYQVQFGDTYAAEDTPGTAKAAGNYNVAANYEPRYVSLVCNGEVGEARITAALLPEDMDGDVTLGQAAQVVDTANGNNRVVFDGVVIKKHVTIGGRSTTAEVVAYNMGDYLLHRIACHGQYRRSPDQEADLWSGGPKEGDPISVTLDDDLVKIDSPLVFNPDGQPNRTVDSFYTTADDGTESDDFNGFEVPFRDQVNGGGQSITADYWRLADAIVYLLNTSPVATVIDPNSFDTQAIVKALPTNPVVSNINCEGKSLGHALADLLTPHNYGYWVSPGFGDGTDGSSDALHQITFFARGDDSNATSLRLSARGTNAGDSDANAVQLDLTFDASPVVNSVEAYGDRLSFTTLAHTNPPSGAKPQLPKLVRGWKGSDLQFAYEADGTTVNPWDITFRKKYANPALIVPPDPTGGDTADQPGIYGVGRMWLVNLGEVPADDLENLSKDLIDSGSSSSSSSSSSGSSSSGDSTILGTNSVDPRRLERPELYDQNTAGGLLHQEDVVVEMSLDGGTNWNIVEKSEYRLLPDSMGLVFVNPNVEELGLYFKSANSRWPAGATYWQVLSDDGQRADENTAQLQIRVLCAIKSDERLCDVVTNDASAFPLACAAVYNNAGYKRCLYNDAINDAVYYTTYPPSRITQDDTANLSELVKAQLQATNRTMVSGRAEVLMKDLTEYTPGMTISSIDNRSFDLSSNPTILRVIWKFAEQQTEIVLDNHRVQSVLKAKPITAAENRRQHQLGVENVTSFNGGHQVPYLPGDRQSYLRYLETGGTP